VARSSAARVADVLAKAASSANTDIQGMGLAMSYAAPNAHALGLTLEETAAYIGKLADAGFDGSRAGTAMATMMSQFQNPASTFRRELASIGIRTNDFSQAIRELAATGPKGQAAISALGEAAGPAFRALVGQGIEAVDELNNKLKGATGFATTQAEEMGNNLRGAFDELSSAWDTFKGKIGAPILDPLKDKVKELAAVISDLVNSGKVDALGKAIADTFAKGADAVIRFVKEFDFGWLIDKVSGGFEKLSGVGTGLNGAFQALNITFQAVKSGLASIAGIIALVGEGFIRVASGIVSGAAKISDVLGFDGVAGKLNELKQSLNETAEAVAEFESAMGGAITSSAESMKDSLKSIAGTAEESQQRVAESAKRIPQATADAVEAAKQPILGFAQVAIDAAREVTDTAITEADKQTAKADKAKAEAKTAEGGKKVILQMGSYADRNSADAQRAKLAMLGVNARVASSKRSDGQTVYRIQSGRLSRAEAQALSDKLRGNGIDTLTRQAD